MMTIESTWTKPAARIARIGRFSATPGAAGLSRGNGLTESDGASAVGVSMARADGAQAPNAAYAAMKNAATGAARDPAAPCRQVISWESIKK
jgi:hypothetical protein